MTVLKLIEKLQQYPTDAEINFYYADGYHSSVNEAMYDPEFKHLPNANFLEITIR